MGPKNRTLDAEAFWAVVARLKSEPRRGWTRKLGLERAESVADHSYAVAMLCLFEAGRRGGYDVERLLKLALLHDLDEAVTGDFTPEDKRRAGSAAIERARRAARKKILRKFPESQRREWAGLWTDLTERRSAEARLVKDVDSTEMALQAHEYERLGARRSEVGEFYASALEGVEDSALRSTVERVSGKKRGKR